jgi:phosphohistidine phosphatase
MRALYLLRHAKSSWDDPSLDDHDRPLAGRGRKAGAAMAGYLLEHGIATELVLCSTATRTRQTLELLAEAVAGAEVAYEAALYGAPAATLLRRLRSIPDGVHSVLLIAHNPGVHDLALELAAPSPKRAAMEAKFPTGALAALRFDGSWSELGGAELALTDFVRPRDLA